MTDENYNFDLPEGLIAQEPTTRRGGSRLLLVDPGSGPVGEVVFRELTGLLRPGDLLILNESRVLPARLATRRVDTGGRVEILLIALRDTGDTWQAMARPARRLRPGIELEIVPPDGTAPCAGAPRMTVRSRSDDGTVEVEADGDLALLAEDWGTMPLPPYIRREPDDARAAADRERYQTVFARRDPHGAGSVAAPTAGLHFSPTVLADLRAAGVATATIRLHVGPGTFQPPSADQITARRLHGESFRLPAATTRAIHEARRQGGRVIAVGTTSLRVLETVARLDLPAAGGPDRDFGGNDPVFVGSAHWLDGAWEVAGTTRLFIAPPDGITAADGLLTNFHLPGSSLLMLVAALVGDPAWRRVYDHAVAEDMRFYSYGDCMLILPSLSERGTM